MGGKAAIQARESRDNIESEPNRATSQPTHQENRTRQQDIEKS
jgi:hypothetical protein